MNDAKFSIIIYLIGLLMGLGAGWLYAALTNESRRAKRHKLKRNFTDPERRQYIEDRADEIVEKLVRFFPISREEALYYRPLAVARLAAGEGIGYIIKDLGEDIEEALALGVL